MNEPKFYTIRTEGDRVVDVKPEGFSIRLGDTFVVLYSPFLTGKPFMRSVMAFHNGIEIPVFKGVTIDISDEREPGIVYTFKPLQYPKSSGEVVDKAPVTTLDTRPRLISEHWFKNVGDGWVAHTSVFAVVLPPLEKGKEVIIDGEVYTIASVEHRRSTDNGYSVGIAVSIVGDRKGLEVIHIPVRGTAWRVTQNSKTLLVSKLKYLDYAAIEKKNVYIEVENSLYKPKSVYCKTSLMSGGITVFFEVEIQVEPVY